MFLPSDFLAHEISFVLWSFVILIGLAILLSATSHHPPRPNLQMTGLGLMILGTIAAIPHAPRAFRSFLELVTPAPSAKNTVLAQDQTVDGVALKAGSVAAVMPDGRLVTAELKSPTLIDGLTVIGHVEFFRVHQGMVETNRLYRATLASDQEIPASPGMWCSPKRVFQVDPDIGAGNLMECELARDVTRDGITISAGSFIQCQPSNWTIELAPNAEPASIDGISVPGGWHVSLMLDPTARLLTLYSGVLSGPGGQDWVEVAGVRLTGFLSFNRKSVSGTLWQDATLQGSLHKAGESVEVQR